MHEDLETKFRAMPDQVILDRLQSGELKEPVRAFAINEAIRRGLLEQGTESAELDQGRPIYRDLMTIGRFQTPFEAELACQRLQAEGIDAVVVDGHMGMMLPDTIGGIRVQAPKEEAKRAHLLLQGIESGVFEIDEPTPEDSCPRCSSDRITAKKRGWLKVLVELFIGVHFGDRHRCEMCLHTWK